MRSCLICDDHALIRDALATAIAARWPGVAIAQADDFPQGWASAASAQPEVCVVDLAMPGADPREGIAGLRRAAPDARILVVTGLSDDRLMLDLVADGVAGFAQKTSGSHVILAALELILAGGRYLPPRIAELATGAAPSEGARKSPAALLTPRQTDVLALLAQGLSNKQIARELGVAPATVKTHVAQAIAVVGAANRTDAAMRAKGLGLI